MLGFRSFSSSEHADYRFCFNGMEKDDEVHNVSGSSYDFGARMYDTRVGRWMSRDPFAAKYTDLSPYNFVANSPLTFIDPNGKEIVIVGDSDFANRVNAYLEKIKATDLGARIIETLDDTHEKIYITEAFWLKASGYFEDENKLRLGSVPPFRDRELAGADEFIALAHEIYHAYSDITNSDGLLNDAIINETMAEYTAVYFENYIRSVYGYDRLRLKYTGVPERANGSIFESTSETYFNPQLEKITDFKINPAETEPIEYPGDQGTLQQIGNRDLPKFNFNKHETATFTQSKNNPKTGKRETRKKSKETTKRATPRSVRTL